MKIKEAKEKEYKDWYDMNSDPYSRRCFTYAEDWAELLEDLIDKSNETPLEVVMNNAEKTSDKADYDGITGFMYGVAIQILAQYWVYGEELSAWHDKQIKKVVDKLD